MKIKHVKIEDCAEVRPGFSAKGAILNDPEGTLQVITAQHITRGEAYRYNENHSLLISPPKFYEKYLVAPGDILFMSRGMSNYAVLIESVPDPTIAPLSFFIIKAKKKCAAGVSGLVSQSGYDEGQTQRDTRRCRHANDSQQGIPGAFHSSAARDLAEENCRTRTIADT